MSWTPSLWAGRAPSSAWQRWAVSLARVEVGPAQLANLGGVQRGADGSATVRTPFFTVTIGGAPDPRTVVGTPERQNAIVLLYQVYLRRTPSPKEVAYYDTSGKSIQMVQTEILTSDEFTALLIRGGDNGLPDWANAALAKGMDVAAIAVGLPPPSTIAKVAETVSRFGG